MTQFVSHVSWRQYLYFPFRYTHKGIHFVQLLTFSGPLSPQPAFWTDLKYRRESQNFLFPVEVLSNKLEQTRLKNVYNYLSGILAVEIKIQNWFFRNSRNISAGISAMYRVISDTRMISVKQLSSHFSKFENSDRWAHVLQCKTGEESFCFDIVIAVKMLVNHIFPFHTTLGGFKIMLPVFRCNLDERVPMRVKAEAREMLRR